MQSGLLGVGQKGEEMLQKVLVIGGAVVGAALGLYYRENPGAIAVGAVVGAVVADLIWRMATDDF